MTTFSLPVCPHCQQHNSNGEVLNYLFQATASLNFTIQARCQCCQNPLWGLAKIAFAQRDTLAQAQHSINQHQGQLEQLACIQLIRWLPALAAQ